MHATRKSHRIAAFAGSMMMLFATLAPAAPADDIDARYRQERAACDTRPINERTTCLREAAAARQAARGGQLNDAAGYQQNALERCQALPAAERESCVHRTREGQTSGSVESGGIIREYREVTLPPAPDAQPASGTMPPAEAPAQAEPVPQPAPAGVMMEQR